MSHDPNEIHNERQRAFQEYKKRVKQSGKPFFPFGVWHDTIAVLLTIILLPGLTVAWYGQAACGKFYDPTCQTPNDVKTQEELKEDGRLPLGPLYEDKADPATTQYHPRPEWYFYFLFDLLRIFKWPDTVILGTIGLPTIAIVLLMAWPFIDRKRERRPSRRPLAVMGAGATAVVLLALTYDGMHSGESGGGPALDPKVAALPGGEIVLAAGSPCLSCHVIGDQGTSNLGAPDLTAEGTKGRGLEWQTEHLTDPPSKVPGSAMPAFGGLKLSEQETEQVAQFLESLGNEDNLAKYGAGGGSGGSTSGEAEADSGAGEAGAEDSTTDENATERAEDVGAAETGSDEPATPGEPQAN